MYHFKLVCPRCNKLSEHSQSQRVPSPHVNCGDCLISDGEIVEMKVVDVVVKERGDNLTTDDVKQAIMKWPGLYETADGRRFKGSPVSEVPTRLREDGWRNVPRMDSYYLRDIGLEIVTARYVGGARPKRFCNVVVAEERETCGS